MESANWLDRRNPRCMPKPARSCHPRNVSGEPLATTAKPKTQAAISKNIETDEYSSILSLVQCCDEIEDPRFDRRRPKRIGSGSNVFLNFPVALLRVTHFVERSLGSIQRLSRKRSSNGLRDFENRLATSSPLMEKHFADRKPVESSRCTLSVLGRAISI